MDKVNFKQSIKIGELLTLLAKVNFTGRTSMEIGIKVIAEDIRNNVVRHTNSCFFTMVAVDENGKSVEVPPLEPVEPEDVRRFEAAKERRKLRLEK